MRIKYFEDTDTTLVELSTNPSVETQELNENVYIDLDGEGRVVSITIEHAGQSADMREFLYQRIPADLSTS
jgi:uncharacterized protein YuzE